VKLPRRAHRVRVPGFRFAGARGGLKAKGADVALIVSDTPATVAGVLTKNRAPAAPVQVTRRRLVAGRARAVLVHAGNANAATSMLGVRTTEMATAMAGRLLGIAPASVLPCATGKIGVQVPRVPLVRGIRGAVAALGADGFPAAAQAILTTDAFAKTAVRRLVLGGRPVTLAVMGKGAGMIAPNMATMLVFATTDAALAGPYARRALREACDGTLNTISVDGDTSTNDTVLLLANGAAGNRPVRAGTADGRRFAAALANALEEIGRLIVLDGEGSQHLVEVHVRGARTDEAARRVARSIATSTLCKCAFHGADPNWGRIVCAAGNAGVPVEETRMDVGIDGVLLLRRGVPQPARALASARRRMRRRTFRVEVDLHAGRGTSRMLTCDLGQDFVHFNSAYTT
jgi:glutamate N-acetyltransferase/amino-acid N-acetyltransferase